MSKSATVPSDPGSMGVILRRPLRAQLLLVLASVPLLAAAAPSARAAEGFVGILEDGRLARFQSDALPGMSSPVRLRGMSPREQIVALGHAPGGRVLAIGSSARLYTIDARTARAYRIGPPFVQGLRGTRFSLVVAPDGRSARLLSDVGQDLFVDTATGATAVGGGMRRTDGTTTYAAVDRRGSTGALVGVDIARGELVEEVLPPPAAAWSALAARPLDLTHAPELSEPSAFTVDSTGAGWVLAAASAQRTKARNSVLQRVDLTTSTAGSYPKLLMRRMRTFAAVGPVADDTRAPRLSVRLPPKLPVRALLASRLPLRASVSEGALVNVEVRLGNVVLAEGAASTDVAGRVVFPTFFVRSTETARALRRSVGRRVRLRFVVADWAGNLSVASRTVQLTR